MFLEFLLSVEKIGDFMKQCKDDNIPFNQLALVWQKVEASNAASSAQLAQQQSALQVPSQLLQQSMQRDIPVQPVQEVPYQQPVELQQAPAQQYQQAPPAQPFPGSQVQDLAMQEVNQAQLQVNVPISAEQLAIELPPAQAQNLINSMNSENGLLPMASNEEQQLRQEQQPDFHVMSESSLLQEPMKLQTIVHD